MANDSNMVANGINKFTEESELDELFNSDAIDMFDDDNELVFETNDDGDYVRILDHIVETINVGTSKPNVNQRAELFHESVVQTVLDSWLNCRQMCCRLLAQAPFVGILLDAKDPAIGGFSKKDRRNEEKGTIIECINSGQIITLMTPMLKELQYFVFLPNVQTLTNMQEFPLLSEAIYDICFISYKGDVFRTDIDVTYKSIANVVFKDLRIQDILIAALEGVSADRDDHEYDEAEADSVVDEEDMDAVLFDDEDDFEDEEFDPYSDPSFAETKEIEALYGDIENEEDDE